jgi:hypothetical protein
VLSARAASFISLLFFSAVITGFIPAGNRTDCR